MNPIFAVADEVTSSVSVLEVTCLVAVAVSVAIVAWMYIKCNLLKRKYVETKEKFDNIHEIVTEELGVSFNEKKRTLEADFRQKKQHLEGDYAGKLIKLESDRREILARDNAALVKRYSDTFDVENAHIISQALASQESKLVIDIIKATIEKRFGRMSQEFIGCIADETDGLAADVQFALCESIWESFQQMKEAHDEAPYIIPQNCRLAYTRGERTVMLIEQEPQTRTMGFHSSLLTNEEAQHAVRRDGDYFWFNLAFPYVYFFMVYDKTLFQYLEVYFRNKSLTSCRQEVYFAPLPNIFRNKGPNYTPMCLGTGFWDQFNNSVENQTFAAKCDYVVSHFWQAPFNNHLGKWGTDRQEVDQKVRTYSQWQAESGKNPLFVLKVQWPSHKSVKGVLEGMFDNRPHDRLSGIEVKIRGLLDQGVKKITGRLQQEITHARAHYAINPEDLQAEVKSLVEGLVTDHAKKVFNAVKNQL